MRNRVQQKARRLPEQWGYSSMGRCTAVWDSGMRQSLIITYHSSMHLWFIIIQNSCFSIIINQNMYLKQAIFVFFLSTITCVFMNVMNEYYDYSYALLFFLPFLYFWSYEGIWTLIHTSFILKKKYIIPITEPVTVNQVILTFNEMLRISWLYFFSSYFAYVVIFKCRFF